jgi:hypothetical protein
MSIAEDRKDGENFTAVVLEVLKRGNCKTLASLRRQFKYTIEQ